VWVYIDSTNLAHERQQRFVAAADTFHHFVQQSADHSELSEQFAHLRLRWGHTHAQEATQTYLHLLNFAVELEVLLPFEFDVCFSDLVLGLGGDVFA